MKAYPGQALAATVNGVLCVALCIAALAPLAWQWQAIRVQAIPPARVGWALLALLGWMLLVVLAWRRTRGAAPALLASGGDGESTALLIAHASQTGYAEQLAWQTATTLDQAGVAVRVQPLHALDAAALRDAGRVLLVASTTGEGDAPDAAAGFVRRVMSAPATLHGVHYGLLALGDSNYARYCGFGRALHDWLRRHGASALFDPVEVDNGDADALRRWQWQLGVLCGAGEMPDWQPPAYRRWRLVDRRLLNQGCHDNPCFHLALRALDPADADWQAGDIAEIGPRHAADTVEALLHAAGLDGRGRVETDRGGETLAEVLARSHLPATAEIAGLAPQALVARLQALPHREYSIASLPADGELHLLLRRMRRPDGRPGLGSGWLTMHAPLGAEIDLRIRRNASFRPPADARPLILVGNGTGIAGLRALLKARVTMGHRDNWLLFGERHAAHDRPYRDELERWQADGWLHRVDLAFSRDPPRRVYVQDLLRAAPDHLREWVEGGAAIYVCGSQQGMAHGVHDALLDILGEPALEAMVAKGRYRRDVY